MSTTRKGFKIIKGFVKDNKAISSPKFKGNVTSFRLNGFEISFEEKVQNN